MKVTGTGERTALANIMRLVEQAQTSRSRAQALADRAAFVLTIIAVVTGALTFVVWLAVGATGAFAVERLVSVLVIACPHALGLAVPLVAAISPVSAHSRDCSSAIAAVSRKRAISPPWSSTRRAR